MRAFVLAILAALVLAGNAHAHVCEREPPTVSGATYPDSESLAYACRQRAEYRTSVKRDDVLVLIDFKYSSGFARFFVIDTASGAVVSRHFTTHGEDSDRDNDGRPDGREGNCNTLYGAYVTLNANTERSGSPYVPLRGLTHPDAEKRGVRIAAREYARTAPRRGMSCGGFMLTPSVIRDVVDRVQGGALLVAVPPDG